MAKDADAVLQLYDTFLGTKRPLTLLEPGKCGIYCCGPTVYDMSHVGHGRAALAPDVLVRFLRYQGLEVTYVRNITDIDDKIIARANERAEDPSVLAQRFTDEYLHDLDAMGLVRPDAMPRVTQTMDEIIALVQRLIDKDLAYPVDGDVYYAVENFEPYGRLSKRNLDDMQAGARVDVDQRKRNPADFALWKAAKPGEPAWESPWGPGRPGWHIECSAMSCKHLGKTFDIHTGGRDLIFPHHENEIAQSQGAYGEDTYARHWMHNGFVDFAGEKMSKSLGNFFTIREVTALYHPEVLRYFLLSVHYRSAVNFDVEVRCPHPQCGVLMSHDEQQAGSCSKGHSTDRDALRTQVRFPGLEEADERVAYIYETLQQAIAFVETAKYQENEDDGPELPDPVGGMLQRFIAAMRDDLNTAAAFAELSEPLNTVNRLLASGKGVPKDERKRTIARFVSQFAELGRIVGCFERNPDGYLQARRDLKARRIGLDTDAVLTKITARNEAREAKDWDRADTLRVELGLWGVKLRDVKGETFWSL